MAGVGSGPIIGTIIKPSVGLSPGETADLVRLLVEAEGRTLQGLREALLAAIDGPADRPA